MANRIQLRRDGAQQWANVNPILAQGELGIEIDTSRIKIGDGVTPWNSLKYERPIETESNTANTLVKRDADGNFSAGAITGSLIGNAATATRLANTRSITLAGDMSGSASFDGSANVNITAELNYVTSLPHYDPGNLSATGTYTQLTIDSRGRIINASNPTSLSQFGITDAQPLDSDLTSLANMTGFGLISRQGSGDLVNRTITGAAARIVVTNGTGQSANPLIDLADTPVVVGQYNPNDNLSNSLISIAGNGNQTVNATQLTVDRYGRLTQALTIPIATATEGSIYPAYDNAVAYDRFDIIEASNGRVYQAAIRDIGAGLGEPTHTDTSDAGGWRYLWSAQIEQKGLASFAQEDFNVTVWDGTNSTIGGHVTIAENAVENYQLQSHGLLMFTDQNTTETFELDRERTTDNAYHGITKINHLNVNNRGGNVAFRVVGYDTAEYPFQPSILSQGNSYPSVALDDPNGNGSATSGSSLTGAVDINLDTTLSGNLTLDVTKVDQFIKRTSGNLEIALEVDEASNRSMDINVTNAGAGDAVLNITADQDITISVTDVDHRVNVEDFHFQDNVLSTTNSTLVLDPNDDDDVTGVVRIRGDLTVDGVTTTVNSTVVTIDDVIVKLGGDTAPIIDDGKDRGIEFNYYDTQARVGFFGWDEDYADANIWSGTGGYRFLYNATNSSEVLTGTDAPLIAGNLRLTTNTGSTSTTSGTLVVTGGTGISERLYVGGRTFLESETHVYDNLSLRANDRQFLVTNAGSNVKFRVESNTGDTTTWGTFYAWGQTQVDDNVIFKQTSTESGKRFVIMDDTVEEFTVDYTTGNVHTEGQLDVDGAVTFNNTLDVDGAVTLNNTLDVDLDSVFHDDITLDTNNKFFTITNGAVQTFRVASTSGDTDIEGTLNVGAFSTFENTTNITVDATSSESDITLTLDGNTTFEGGVNIEKDVRIATDLYVGDRIVVKDAGTARTRPSLLNNVDIKYHAYLGSSNAQNSAYADDAAANLRVAGGAGIVQDLHVGDDFYVGKVGAADTVEFSVLGESGYTTIGRVGQGNATDGALVVHGDATFNREVNITGYNTTIGDANTDVLTVNAVSTFTDNVTVNGDLEVDQNVIINQNLTVHGTTTTVNSTVVTIDDPIFTLGGDTAPASNDGLDKGIEFRYYDNTARLGFFGWDESAARYAFYHNATNTTEVFSGTRSGIDAGSLKLFDTTNATNSASGTLIVGGGASVGLDLYVGDDLNVTDDVVVGGNIAATGAISTQSNFSVQTVFTVAQTTGNTYVGGTLQVNGNATIGNAGTDAHVITGTVTFNQAITSTDITADQIKIGVDASNEISTTAGDLILDSAGGTVNVTDDLDVDQNLNVDGNAVIDGTLQVDGALTLGSASNQVHTLNGSFRMQDNLWVTNYAFIDGVHIGGNGGPQGLWGNGGNLILDATTNIVEATSNFIVRDDLTVDDNVILGSSNIDTLTVNATSTFLAAITSTDITADNIKIGVDGSSEISTTSGNLTLDSFTGETIIDDNTSITGTLDVDGQVTITDGILVNAANESLYLQNGSGVNKFVVDFNSGNTDIAGTLDVTGATVLTSTLNTQGAADFDTTVNIDGITTITDTSNSNLVNTLLGIGDMALDVAGGAKIGGNVGVGGDLQIYGDFTVDGNVVQKGNQEFSGRVEFSKNETPSSLTANAPLMVTNGGITVYEHSYFGQDLYIGPNAATTISLYGATGNATFAGTLGVTGATTLSTLSASSITTSASVNVGGSLLINTNKFTVTGSTGNTSIAGTLGVTGATTLNSTLNVVNAVDFDSTLNVDGAATFNSTITQNSTSRFNDNIVLQGASKTLQLNNGAGTTKIELQSTSGNITAGGLTTTNSLDVTTNTTIGGTLGVTGQITGNVTGDLTGTADKANLVDVTETATSNLTYYPAFVSANTGFTEIRTDSQNLTYNPSTNTLTVNNFKSQTNFEVQGNLNITGNITYGQSQVGDISNHDTDALAEGTTNLYFTNERVDDRVAALVQGGNGIAASYDDLNNLLSLSVDFGEISTTDLTEGTNLFYTNARADARVNLQTGSNLDLSQKTTSDLAEGTNLYHTTARARGAISATGSLSYNASTGVLSYTAPTLAAVATSGAYSDLSGTPNLAAVATSGAYGDLSGTPDISTFGATLIDDGSPLAARTTLGLGSAATTSSTAYATAAQGTTADDTDGDLDSLYTALNAIGTNAGITNVAGLKAALAALVRS